MKRIYHPYWLWEDYINGMYDNNTDNIVIEKSKTLLKNPTLFYDTMINVLSEFKISSDCNLSNTSCNRRAWLGQAACNLLYKASEKQVRIAWSELTEMERLIANIEAEKIIKIYEARYNRIHQKVGTELLF